MSQCLACDNELRGYMAMGKQVLTLTYIHTILLGIYDFSTLNLIAERLQNFTVKYTICLSCGKILCNQHSWFMFLCPNNQKERRGKILAFNSISPRDCPIDRGCHLRADHRLRYLLSSRYPISMKLRALTLLQHLPLP